MKLSWTHIYIESFIFVLQDYSDQDIIPNTLWNQLGEANTALRHKSPYLTSGACKEAGRLSLASNDELQGMGMQNVTNI